MKMVNRPLGETADVSAARNTAMPELRRLMFFAVLLAVGLYLGVGLIVDLIVPTISSETEAKLFGSATFGVVASTNADERLDRAEVILTALTADRTISELPYKLFIIDNDKPNAFAFPGGRIGVTTGLLDVLEEDIELAFVLGHELGHFHNRDHLRGMGRAIGVGVAYAVVFGGEMGSGTLSRTFQYILQRGYSRRQEDHADHFGVELVYRVYGRTNGIEKLFELLRQEDEIPEWAYMFSTHPSPDDRIENLQQYADEMIKEKSGE